MKKRIAIVLCLLLLTGCASTYDGATELRSVLESTEETYIGTGGNIYQTLWTEYSYDIYGNVAQTIESRNDEPTVRTVYRHDEDGALKSVTQYDLTGWFPWPSTHAAYTYDEHGRQTGLVQWDGLDKMEQTTTYDNENNVITTVFDGGVTVVQLNGDGTSLRSETTYEDGSVELIEHEYLENTHITHCYRNGEPDTVYENTYDDQGRELTWSEYVDGQWELIWRWEYGEDYKTCYYGQIQRSITTGYNEDGTVKAVVETDENDQITRRVIYRYTEIRVPAEEGATT